MKKVILCIMLLSCYRIGAITDEVTTPTDSTSAWSEFPTDNEIEAYLDRLEEWLDHNPELSDRMLGAEEVQYSVPSESKDASKTDSPRR